MVNNNLVPPTNKNFNSYNQPSVNQRGLVAIRAQSRGGEGGGGGETIVDAPGSGGEDQPVHGIYTRDMSVPESLGVIVRILDRKTKVPQPNNLAACRTFAVTSPDWSRTDQFRLSYTRVMRASNVRRGLKGAIRERLAHDCRAKSLYPASVATGSLTRSGTVPRQFLFPGGVPPAGGEPPPQGLYLLTDGYSGDSALALEVGIRGHAACWAHVRLKFVEATEGRKNTAAAHQMVALIGQRYAVERRLRAGSAAKRQAERQTHSRPILEKIKAWREARSPTSCPRGCSARPSATRWGCGRVHHLP